MAIDRRALNGMDEYTRTIWRRLEVWAKDVIGDQPRAWPRETLLARVIKFGPLGASQNGAPVFMSAEALAVDAAVAKLCEIDRTVLMERLMSSDPIEVSARKLKMRVRQVQNVVKRAVWRVGGYLDRDDEIRAAESFARVRKTA